MPHPQRLIPITTWVVSISAWQAVLAQQAEAPSPPVTVQTGPDTIALLLQWVPWIASVLAVVGLTLWWIVSRVRAFAAESRRREEEAARRFERSVMRSLEPDPATPREAAEQPLQRPESPEEDALRRLRESGLVDHAEDLVLSPGEPAVQFLRMTGGRTAILFPVGTSLDHAFSHDKAADLFILLRENGEPAVCRPLGEYLSDEMFGT